MIGRRYWIWIWWGIMVMGVTGLAGAIHWGIKTQWRNIEEILRGAGTILVSAGFLMLLYHVGSGAGTTLLVAAIIAFVLAFAIGRNSHIPPDHPPDYPGDTPSDRTPPA